MKQLYNELSITEKLDYAKLTPAEKQETSTATLCQVLNSLYESYSNTDDEHIAVQKERMKELINNMMDKDTDNIQNATNPDSPNKPQPSTPGVQENENLSTTTPTTNSIPNNHQEKRRKPISALQ